MIQQLNNIILKRKRLAVGLMSGTSLDGVDAGLVEITGSSQSTRVKLIDFLTIPYSREERDMILELCSPSTSTVDQVCKWNVQLGKKFAEAANAVIDKANLSPSDIDFISSHGQTIYHDPGSRSTLQIGELAVIATETNCVTVGDFRPHDMALGGQGAPLVPFIDHLLFSSKDNGRILINIGGISNLTVLPANSNSSDVTAFDVGPGNVLIDAIVKLGTTGRFTYDKDGKIAKTGMIHNDWLNEIIANDTFIPLKPPKSTGRELYTLELANKLWNDGTRKGLTFEDIVATITTFTAKAIVLNIQQFVTPSHKIKEVFIGGGGVKNEFLMSRIISDLEQDVLSMEQLGIPSDAKEAIAFTILGNEFLHGNTNNIPTATGASRPVSMGKLAMP